VGACVISGMSGSATSGGGVPGSGGVVDGGYSGTDGDDGGGYSGMDGGGTVFGSSGWGVVATPAGVSDGAYEDDSTGGGGGSSDEVIGLSGADGCGGYNGCCGGYGDGDGCCGGGYEGGG